MSDNNNNKTLSYLEKLKLKASEQKNYGGELNMEDAKISARDCPNCGAGRAYRDGLTNCGYCNFSFMDVKLTDGVYIKKENNSL
jgi:uncharacterized Zn finger protein (UPF0148 family)